MTERASEPSPQTDQRRSAVDGFIPSDSDNISLFPEQVVDNLVHVVIALGAEMWTMRRRMYVLEKVLEKTGVSAEDVETYQPTPEDAAAWAQERDIIIKRTLGALARRGQANQKQLDQSHMK